MTLNSERQEAAEVAALRNSHAPRLDALIAINGFRCAACTELHESLAGWHPHRTPELEEAWSFVGKEARDGALADAITMSAGVEVIKGREAFGDM